MAIKDIYQNVISLNKLYRVTRKPVTTGESEQMVPNLFIDEGSVDVYGYNGAVQPSALANMVLPNSCKNVSATAEFCIIPSYIAIVQNTGTSTELVLSGLSVEEIGDIS